MSDYIKREDAIELAKDSQADLALEGDNQSFAEELESIPSADVAPVRHGEWWEEPYKDDIIAYRCSACRKVHTMTLKGNKAHYAYCPNCGARMDGENGE